MTAAPEPLCMTVHDLPALDVGTQRRVRGRRTMMLVVLACAAPVLLSYFTYFVLRPQGRANYAALIQPTKPIPPDLPLRTEDGTPVRAGSLAGQWLLMVAAKAECDTRCETLLYQQRQLREMTGRERGRIDKIWFVVDDAPLRPALKTALLAPGSEVTVLRVPQAALAAWLAPADGQVLEDHLYVADPYGAWMMRAPAPLDPSRFKRDLDRLLRASAFWDREGREAAVKP